MGPNLLTQVSILASFFLIKCRSGFADTRLNATLRLRRSYFRHTHYFHWMTEEFLPIVKEIADFHEMSGSLPARVYIWQAPQSSMSSYFYQKLTEGKPLLEARGIDSNEEHWMDKDPYVEGIDPDERPTDFKSIQRSQPTNFNAKAWRPSIYSQFYDDLSDVTGISFIVSLRPMVGHPLRRDCTSCSRRVLLYFRCSAAHVIINNIIQTSFDTGSSRHRTEAL